MDAVTETQSGLDGQQFKQMVHAALLWLRQHQAAINALNVFPVPDGDTGTNMMLTMTSAWNEIEYLQDDNIGEIAGKVAYGALMGARGNSGVILSQIWRGFARGLDHQLRMDVQGLAEAMQRAAETAYKGVVKPVEGTILTVIREVAEEAQVVAPQTQDVTQMLEQLVRRAKAAEARTPALLPVLRQAGVVDSGGQGLVVILEGMLRYLKGQTVEEGERPGQVVDLAAVEPHPAGYGESAEPEFDANYPYDVQFIIMGEDYDLDVPAIRARIEAMGDCPLVVGDARAVKVHVHVADPGVPISFGAQQGPLRDVVVENMAQQYQEFIAGRTAAMAPATGPVLPAILLESEPQPIGVVAVVVGEGLEKVFRSLGATAVVHGGQTMNPSTADILEALRTLKTEKAIILPNNKNILMTAQQAAEMAEGLEVAVVPTRSLPQGIAALLVLDQQATLDSNAAAMSRAAREIITGEVTYAVRDVALDGVTVHEGDAIGLLDEALVVTGKTFEEVVRRLLEKVPLEDRELVTLYYGADVEEETAQALGEELAALYPALEFEVIAGGQAHYPYLLSIE
ncbi:MAG TPA: DAK2 domain-containing protein [Anaerolineae bacterium]|nr:DAK2 domain-containing protein [Anaerolineae bacterium]